MKDWSSEFNQQYAAALKDYLAGEGEPALERAYELGRLAMEKGLGVLEVVTSQGQALARMLALPASKSELAHTVRLASEFLRESLSPFEMAQRGYQETLVGLRHMTASLEQLVAERTSALTAEVNERRRAEEKIQRHLNRLAALRAIDMAITSSLDLRVTFNVLLDQVTTQLAVDAATVLLFNAHLGVLEYAAGRGFRSPALQHTSLRLGEGHAGRAALERRTLYVANLPANLNAFARAPALASEGFISYFASPLIAKGQIKGVLELFHRSALAPDEEWMDFLETLATQAAIAIDDAELFTELHRSNLELSLAYDATIEGWSRALDLRDKETEGHTQRVTQLTMRLARAMKLPESELVHIRRGALLHDIGKMGIPDSILLKAGPLSDEEWEIMRQHPVYAYQMLSPIDYLRPALDIPYCHHEKWDGSGYPRGLKGEQIPIAARIFALADVWDALLSDRPYRPAWTKEKALDYIRAGSGIHFDPAIVKVFLQMDL